VSQPNPSLTRPTIPTVPAGPVAAPAGPRERRVRFGHLALAVALVVVGALGTATLVTVVSARGEYLALARDVEYGAQIAQEDLAVVRISNPPGLRAWPAREIGRAVGNYATMPLAAGTLLTGAHVTDQRFPAAGEVRLGVTLASDRLPAQRLQPGNLVLLVDTGDPGGGDPGGGDPGGGDPAHRTWQATVLRVVDGGSGSILSGSQSRDTTIDIIVTGEEAPTIAALAADDRLSVAVLPGQPER
jgi:hypothetical protein